MTFKGSLGIMGLHKSNGITPKNRPAINGQVERYIRKTLRSAYMETSHKSTSSYWPEYRSTFLTVEVQNSSQM